MFIKIKFFFNLNQEQTSPTIIRKIKKMIVEYKLKTENREIKLTPNK
jgi:hypothetical protein